ncbi:hypothetical protein NMY22_g3693 [Coprinellus aureogranulatus]|nr:hypothetical protein NMY22_g3693 [Coprinellus aureogranulatus]
MAGAEGGMSSNGISDAFEVRVGCVAPRSLSQIKVHNDTVQQLNQWLTPEALAGDHEIEAANDEGYAQPWLRAEDVDADNASFWARFLEAINSPDTAAAPFGGPSVEQVPITGVEQSNEPAPLQVNRQHQSAAPTGSGTLTTTKGNTVGATGPIAMAVDSSNPAPFAPLSSPPNPIAHTAVSPNQTPASASSSAAPPTWLQHYQQPAGKRICLKIAVTDEKSSYRWLDGAYVYFKSATDPSSVCVETRQGELVADIPIDFVRAVPPDTRNAPALAFEGEHAGGVYKVMSFENGVATVSPGTGKAVPPKQRVKIPVHSLVVLQ